MTAEQVEEVLAVASRLLHRLQVGRDVFGLGFAYGGDRYDSRRSLHGYHRELSQPIDRVMPEETAAAKRRSEGSVTPTPGSGGRIAACLGIYVLASVVMGRDVLAQLNTSIANDAGDPLLTTAILHWVATHLPYTDWRGTSSRFFSRRATP